MVPVKSSPWRSAWVKERRFVVDDYEGRGAACGHHHLRLINKTAPPSAGQHSFDARRRAGFSGCSACICLQHAHQDTEETYVKQSQRKGVEDDEATRNCLRQCR